MLRAAWLDRLGITASLGCAVHCVLTALFFILAPSFFQSMHFINGLSFLTNEWIHIGLAILVFPVALIALSNGYKTHRNISALLLGVFGLILISLGLAIGDETLEITFTMIGGVVLAVAHLLNLRQCQHAQPTL